jgi:hypothetical protein
MARRMNILLREWLAQIDDNIDAIAVVVIVLCAIYGWII